MCVHLPFIFNVMVAVILPIAVYVVTLALFAISVVVVTILGFTNMHYDVEFRFELMVFVMIEIFW